MASTVVEIPESLQELLAQRVGVDQIDAWGLEAMVVEAARQGIISRKKAASLYGITGFEDLTAWFEKHQLNNEYSVEMINEDFKFINSR